MVINITISNKAAYVLIIILFLAITSGIVYAIGGTDPTVHGHDGGEITPLECQTLRVSVSGSEWGTTTGPRCTTLGDEWVRTGCSATCTGAWKDQDLHPVVDEGCELGDNDYCTTNSVDPTVNVDAICCKIA